MHKQLALLLCWATTITCSHLVTTTTLEQDLAAIVTAESTKYDCAISASIYSKSKSISMSSSAGTTSFQPAARKINNDDIFVWGSITKISTGTSILRLVQAGKLNLNDTISQYIDPMIKQMNIDYPNIVNFTCSEDLWGKEIHNVTIWHLATMNSGVPDFDTAKPYPRPPTDSLRQTIYKNPNKDYYPHELISFPWVATGSLEFIPGTKRFAYSSTNFVLLGLILARMDNKERWSDYKQSSFLPKQMLKTLPSVVYWKKGAPINRTFYYFILFLLYFQQVPCTYMNIIENSFFSLSLSTLFSTTYVFSFIYIIYIYIHHIQVPLWLVMIEHLITDIRQRHFLELMSLVSTAFLLVGQHLISHLPQLMLLSLRTTCTRRKIKICWIQIINI